jgi:hypothetical protein
MSFPPSVAWLLDEDVYPEEGEAIEMGGAGLEPMTASL